MKRRTFVNKVGVASSMALLGSCGAAAIANGQRSLGVALLGLGSYSQGQLAPALQMTQHCHLAGIITGTPNKIPQWQQKYMIPDKNIYSYETMEGIADNDDIDIIYIVVPTGLHAQYAIKAANLGKHVWCEKPMALNTDECQAIIDACRSNKVSLSIGYRMQHEANTQTIISYATSQPYGVQNQVVAEAGYAGGGGSGWRHQKSMGGGALYDMGVYTVNAIRYATGQMPVKVVEARHIIKRPELFTEVDETTEYILELESGLIAKGWTSVGEHKNRLRVECDRGWYELQPMQSYNGVRGSTSDGKLLETLVPNQQAQQMDDDALAIINNKPVMVPGIEGLKDIHIINGIFEAAHTGASVNL